MARVKRGKRAQNIPKWPRKWKIIKKGQKKCEKITKNHKKLRKNKKYIFGQNGEGQKG